MPREENPRNYSAVSVSDVAELLGLTDRQVRNLIKDKGLPARSDPRGFTLDWPTALEWYVGYRSAQKGGNGGNRRPGSNPEEPEETYDEALARKTRAEADLKELQLARERGEVAAIADVERVLNGANKSIQTRVLAMPASLATQLLGIDDRTRIFNVLDRSCRDLLTNLASIDAVREARTAQPEADEE
jgi:phage terminase Nu1 subunit (DNA packaging protein)